jgi:excisionase family DNA binding protein
MPQLLTVSEFITVTRISRPTFFRRIKSGEIPHTYLGRRILIPASFLKELEEKARASIAKAEA